MKKIIFTFLFFTQILFSQGEIYIGMHSSLSVSYPNIKDISNYLDGNSNFSFGVTSVYTINNNILLKSGLIFNQRGFKVKGIPNTLGIPFNGDIDWLRTHYNVFSTFEETETYQSIVLPLSFEYKLSEFKESSILFSGGVEVGYLFNVKYTYDYNSGEQRIYNKDYNNFIGSINLGVGLYQPISNNFLLIIFPKYSHSFYPNFGNMSLNFNTFSLDAELYFQLN